MFLASPPRPGFGAGPPLKEGRDGMVEGPEREFEALQTADLIRTLFAEAGDALLIVEPQSERLLDVNPMAQRLTGLSRDGLLRRPLREVIRHELASETWLEAVRRTGTFHG